MTKKSFGSINGNDIYLFTLKNKNGMSVSLSNFGALIIDIKAPDCDGNCENVALGYKTFEEYKENRAFYGAVVGPNANRIENAEFTIDGVTYKLDKNYGEHNLNSHREMGVHKRVWGYEEREQQVKFTLKLKDGELGFPGNKDISVTYSLTDENELSITYDAFSDKNTPINMTNHCYFNLDGVGNGSIKEHEVQIFASAYTPINKDRIPTGDILSVEDTPLDFRTPKKIGEDINSEFEQICLVSGYDHNLCLDNYTGQLRKVAVVKNSSKTRTMEVYTDLPGAQFYDGSENKRKADADSGFAIETQFYPDSVNKLHFPSCIFGPDRKYHTTTIYKFV